MPCRCPNFCGSPDGNQSGCSCKGGERFSHLCRGLNNPPVPQDSLNYHPEDAPHRLSVGAINADASARQSTVRTRAQFLSKVHQFTRDTLRNPDLLSLSEVQSSTFADDMCNTMEALAYSGQYKAYGKKDTDVLLSMYDSTHWQVTNTPIALTIGQRVGRFQVLVLNTIPQTKGNPSRSVAHVSIHGVLKGTPNKKRANNAVRRLIENLREHDVDDFVISGDWNLNPTRIEEEFDHVRPIFTMQHPHTTAAQQRPRRVDNVCCSDGINFDKSAGYVLRDCKYFSHFPILAAIQFAK